MKLRLPQKRTTRLAIGASAAAVVAAAVAVPLAISAGSHHRSAQPTANNISRAFRACLLVMQSDADLPDTQQAWIGLQKAAATWHINAQRTFVPKGQEGSAGSYINGMIQRRCNVIIASGTTGASAAATAASANGSQRFIIIGSAPQLANVTLISPPPCQPAGCSESSQGASGSLADQVAAAVRPKAS